MSDKAKARLEGSVNKVGRALGDLVKVFEKHGHEISDKQFTATMTFLQSALAGATQKAHLGRQMAIATTGSFKLDAEDAASSASPMTSMVSDLVMKEAPPGPLVYTPPTVPLPPLISDEDADFIDDAVEALEAREQANSEPPAPLSWPLPPGAKPGKAPYTYMKPTGRDANTGEIIYEETPCPGTVPPKKKKEVVEPGAVPDHTGGIPDVGWIEE